MGSTGVVGPRSGDVSRGCSEAGALVPRRENTNRTAFPIVPQNRKDFPGALSLVRVVQIQYMGLEKNHGG